MIYTQKRVYKVRLVFFLLSVMLLARLLFLQILDGPKLTVQGLSSRVQEVPVEVPRGEIFDRNGVPLTNTTLQYSVAIFPDQVADSVKTAAELAELIGLDASYIVAEIVDQRRPFKLKEAIAPDVAKEINCRGIPGVVAVAERVRYGYSGLAAHVVGYINTADNKGVSGLEGRFDDLLRVGQTTYLAAMVDAGQQLIPGLGYKRLEYTSGKEATSIVLTLDSNVEKIVENVLDQYAVKGAVVVLRPSTGEVIAMASRPNFDANQVSVYLRRDSSPLVNRAIAAYQPGSVFKLVLAAAALEEGKITPNDTFYDPGYIDVDGQRFKGWDYATGGHGRITFQQALAYSSNPAFINIGLTLGGNTLIKYAKLLGFGEKTGIDIDDEDAGNLPSPDNLYPGDLANLSIGQGSLEATPLQIACLLSVIVNNGIKIEPYLVSQLTTPDRRIIKSFFHGEGKRILSSKTAAKIREMLVMATKNGTGIAAYVDEGGAAGKTGTAETGRKNAAGQSINHAWFAGYAPLDNPQVVVVVFVEDGMSGSEVAAPLFHDIVTQILANDATEHH
ncbi:MAG: Peptidoglycan glycosyltransferase [Firmicutes bacterium]|nr:Peptidoglycan glycosyltransferase [Bacillota bacterium]